MEAFFMGHNTAPKIHRQAKKDNFILEPYPNYSLEEILPLKLVGYARMLSKKALHVNSLTISVSDKYLAKVWNCTTRTVSRKLDELESYGIFFRVTSDYRPGTGMNRVIVLKPLDQSTHNRQVAQQTKMSDHKKTFATQMDRTLQRQVESPHPIGFIPLGGLKELEGKKKRKPNQEVRRLQVNFLRTSIEKILEEDEIDYRFFCLILRNVLGAENPTIAHYGEKLHMNIRFKPEAVIGILELMVSSYSTIKCPIAWLVSELQCLVGIKSMNKPTVDRGDPPPKKEIRRTSETSLSKQGQRALEYFKSKTEHTQ